MNKSKNWIKKSLDSEVFQHNPFNEESKRKILQNLSQRRNRVSFNSIQKIIPIFLTAVVFIGGFFAIGTFVYKDLAGKSHEDIIDDKEGEKEESLQTNSAKANEKTFLTYGIDPATVGVDVSGDKAGFYSIIQNPFAAHEKFPLLNFLDLTETEFIMTGREIDEIHEEFPEINVFIPAGIFDNGELLQAVFVISRENGEEDNEDKILEELKEKYPNVPIFISYSELEAQAPNENILVHHSFGYGFRNYSYIQDLTDSFYTGNISTLLELSKNNKQFVDESVSMENTEMWVRAYKSMTFDGYFFEDGNETGSFPEAKSDLLKAGTLGIWSEIPMNITEQQATIKKMVSTIENFYDTKEFALKVTYHNDLDFLNGNSEEEYGGWSVGYKMPNNPNMIFKHFKE